MTFCEFIGKKNGWSKDKVKSCEAKAKSKKKKGKKK